MDIRLEERADGVTPADALAWWSDFREGTHDHAHLRSMTRTITPTADALMMEDTMRVMGVRVFTERVTARTEDNVVRFFGENSISRFEGAYYFLPAPGGTRVRLEAVIALRGALPLTALVARPIARAVLRSDLRHHIADLRRDLLGL